MNESDSRFLITGCNSNAAGGRSPLGGGPRRVDLGVRWTGLCHSSIIYVSLAYFLVEKPDGIQVQPSLSGPPPDMSPTAATGERKL